MSQQLLRSPLNILPSLPLFRNLVSYAARKPARHCIVEERTGRKVTHTELLSKIGSVLGELSSSLDLQLVLGQVQCICILAPPGYEFAVGFLAAVAALCCVVPLSKGCTSMPKGIAKHHPGTAYPTDELVYFVTKCSATYLFVHQECLDAALDLQKRLSDLHNFSITLLNLSRHIYRHVSPDESRLLISCDDDPDPNADGMIIFTSGTTGRPKGAVFRRRALGADLYDIIDIYNIRSSDVIMHCMPMHHASGLQINFLPFLMAGGCIEFHEGFDASKTWQRWMRGGLTFFSGVPTMYARLMEVYDQHIFPEQRMSRTARSFRALLCGTSALHSKLSRRWKDITGGRGVIERYGATEIGSVFTTSLRTLDLIEVGQILYESTAGMKADRAARALLAVQCQVSI